MRQDALFALASVVLAARADDCALPGWPGVQPDWRHGGASETCFCAYAGAAPLDDACPTWLDYVSTDGATPDKLTTHGAAEVQGRLAGNVTTGRYGSMSDWAVDLGSGYEEDCDATLSPGCASTGAHSLSIPRNEYASQCCDTSDPLSLASWLPDRASTLCNLLRDLVAGGLRAIGPDYRSKPSCNATNEEPTVANGCLAQCFHVTPDVWYAHLHTTVSVKAMKDGPIDSALGPAWNQSEGDNGYYNVCACEPSSWPNGRGNCPAAAPADQAYPAQASEALCRNIAAAAGVDPAPCDACGTR